MQLHFGYFPLAAVVPGITKRTITQHSVGTPESGKPAIVLGRHIVRILLCIPGVVADVRLSSRSDVGCNSSAGQDLARWLGHQRQASVQLPMRADAVPRPH